MNTKIIEILLWITVSLIYTIVVTHRDTVVFLDVGQGDAILIQEGNIQVLVDGGPDDLVLYQLEKYIPVYDRKIEYVVLTHPHDDHLVGLLKVLERYEVGEILYYPVCYENENYEYLLQNYANIHEVGKGDTISLAGVRINILWPILNLEEVGCKKQYNNNLNNDSLVLEFEYLNKSFLLMGDIESDVEKILISEKIISHEYDILKAGHHCSKTSSSETFLNVVSPSMAVCSVGLENPFGHPNSETLKNFSDLGVQYLVTYQEGNIQMR